MSKQVLAFRTHRENIYLTNFSSKIEVKKRDKQRIF